MLFNWEAPQSPAFCILREPTRIFPMLRGNVPSWSWPFANFRSKLSKIVRILVLSDSTFWPIGNFSPSVDRWQYWSRG